MLALIGGLLLWPLLVLSVDAYDLFFPILEQDASALIDGLDTVRVKKSNKPFSGTMRILNQSGSLQGSVSLKNGRLHGEEIFYESDGSVSERNIWKNGRLVE